tara:strand:- start:4801 stop:4968 length:168 start_codon:yes stop_codon:yes gene_type:complete
MDLKQRLLNKEKKDPIDILELYTKKVINRDKQKTYLKKHPELWLKKMHKKKKTKK